jgi:hypothetical protein
VGYLPAAKTSLPTQIDAKMIQMMKLACLLVHNEPLKMLFPHEDMAAYPYGRRRLCNSIQEVDVYNDAS